VVESSADNSIHVPTAVMVDENQLITTTSDTNLSGLLKAKTDVDLIKPSSFNHNLGDIKVYTSSLLACYSCTYSLTSHTEHYK
jgi:hypothetical protein